MSSSTANKGLRGRLLARDALRSHACTFSLFVECLRYGNLPDEEKRVEEVPEVRTLVSKKWAL